MAERARVAVLVSGRGSNMAALVYAARTADCTFEIALVSGDRPDAPGLDLAEAEGVPTKRLAFDRHDFFDRLDAALIRHRIDVVALAGFMRIVPVSFLAQWGGRIVNIHPSLLPRHPGLATHRAVLEAGESVSGCTVHLVDATLDGGPILGQLEVAVMPGDTPDSLAARVLIAEHQLYPRTLAAFVTSRG